MGKNYEVSITAFATVLVINAEDEEAAMTYALNRADLGDLKMDETRIEREIKTAEELESFKRHANIIADDE